MNGSYATGGETNYNLDTSRRTAAWPQTPRDRAAKTLRAVEQARIDRRLDLTLTITDLVGESSLEVLLPLCERADRIRQLGRTLGQLLRVAVRLRFESIDPVVGSFDSSLQPVHGGEDLAHRIPQDAKHAGCVAGLDFAQKFRQLTVELFADRSNEVTGHNNLPTLHGRQPVMKRARSLPRTWLQRRAALRHGQSVVSEGTGVSGVAEAQVRAIVREELAAHDHAAMQRLRSAPLQRNKPTQRLRDRVHEVHISDPDIQIERPELVVETKQTEPIDEFTSGGQILRNVGQVQQRHDSSPSVDADTATVGETPVADGTPSPSATEPVSRKRPGGAA